MSNKNKHILTIKQIYKDASAIYRPEIRGIAHDVYVVETTNGKNICRFTNKHTSAHNVWVSRQLQNIGLIVPDVSVHKLDGQYIETYPFIEGKTFHERLIAGMPEEKRDAVYKQLFDISHKLSQIPYNHKFKTPIHLASKCQTVLFKLLGVKNKKIYHTDLHAKNIILDDKDNVYALLDLDAVYPEFFSLTLIHLMRDAEQYGYDINKIKKFYTPSPQDHLDLEQQIKIYYFLQRMFRFFVNERMYKQLLKIPLK